MHGLVEGGEEGWRSIFTSGVRDARMVDSLSWEGSGVMGNENR